MEKINIQIDKPCSEDFNSFKKSDKGRFCNSCKKTVVDFTKMSDQEFLTYFSTEKNKTCGLFLESQLKSYSNTTISSSKQKSNTFASSIFGLSILSILSFNNGFSQEKTNSIATVKEENIATKKDATPEDINEKFTVSGIVADSSGPLPGANIYFKNYNISTQTDLDGKFTFPKQLKTGDILLVNFIGYKDQEIKVTRQNQSIKVKLEDCQMIMMGEVSTNKVYKSKRTVFQKMKSLFTNE